MASAQALRRFDGAFQEGVLRNPRAPLPFCEVEAPGTGGQAQRRSAGDVHSCLICCQDNPRYMAVGRCGHAEACWLCVVRLRTLLKDFRCPVCKEENSEIALVAVSAESRGPPPSLPSEMRDTKLGLVFDDRIIRAEVDRLFDYTCWLAECAGQGASCSFTTLRGLERHIFETHGRKFCQTCLVGRKVFLHEQLLYFPDDLTRHHRDGDSAHLLGHAIPPLPPHADCTFCRRGFYDQDTLLDHMHKRHLLCTLCERQGRKGEFYSDYSYLSLHYEEKHHVCSHAGCRRGPYKLVAFPSEEELKMHELAEHAALGHASQRIGGRRAARLNLQMGAASYRDEQERRGGQAGASAPRRQAAERSSEVQIRFMWTRGQPQKAPPGVDDVDIGSPAAEDEGIAELYPPRAAGARRSGPETHHSDARSKTTSSRSRPALQADVREEPPGGGVSGAVGSSAGGPAPPRKPSLLDAALASIRAAGVDSAERLEQQAYRERNKAFKVELEAACGVEELSRFKQCSATFRRSLADAGSAPETVKGRHARTYAVEVLGVFGRISEATAMETAAKLLRDLVILLPDQSVRRSLHQALVALQEEEKEAERRAASRATAPAPASTAAPVARRRAAGASGAAESPPGDSAGTVALPPEVEAIPVSRAFWRPDAASQPSFLQALDAVLTAVVRADPAPSSASAGSAGLSRGPAASAALSPAWTKSLSARIAPLSRHQAESLEMMRTHLSALNGAGLEFSPAERLLGLRPQLLLKLSAGRGNTGADARGASAADLSAPWREWKASAVAAAAALRPEERRRVQAYVSLCLQLTTQGGLAGGAMEDFPAMESVAGSKCREAVDGDFQDWEGGANGGSPGKRKGRQKRVLAAWG